MRKTELVESPFGDYKLSYDNTIEAKNLLFKNMLEFFKKVEAFNGESLIQCDEPQLEAPEFLAKVAEDIFQFKVEFLEDIHS